MALSERQEQFKEEIKKLLLSRNGVLPFVELEAKAKGIAPFLFPDLSMHEVSEVLELLTQEHDITLTLGGSIVDPATFERWFDERAKTTETPRSEAYEQLLVARDWEVPVILKLAEQTDEVVELLGDPSKPGPWARHGLLMGEVQSGKTATYLGILNKALDYGYRLIIVIGGHTKELRRQTQYRFDTDLIGFESEYLGDNISVQKLPRVGIGTVDLSLRANVMTTVLEDFSTKSKRAGVTWVTSDIPTVFIIKKHAGLIANVTDYIQMQTSNGRLDIPMVVIDDESDWGTPNTRIETDPTRVNLAIRRLLNVSTRSSYLGITATPFANIFIDDEAIYAHTEGTGENQKTSELPDLFPSDYIRVMSSPSNYLGIGQYFGAIDHDAVSTEVDDCIAAIPIKHLKDHPVPWLPDSLAVAVRQFLLGTAIRRVRDGKPKPASMLINVSRFNNVQSQIADLVSSYLEQSINVIMAELARRSFAMSSHAADLRATWEDSYSAVVDVSWSEVSASLLLIAKEFRVELVNSQTVRERAKRRKLLTGDQRKAEDLRPTIFVGGDVLSRGLTLDGLQVSYFVREPRTMDTLMQMGRWFGYRPGFGDLVRIWMPESTRDDLNYSAEVTEELRELLMQMRARELTPRDFGLRVRSNPDSVPILAANKARNAALVDIGPVLWENRLAESYLLSADPKRQQANRDAVTQLIDVLVSSDIENATSSGGLHAWYGVPLETIIDFFRGFRGHPKDHYWGEGRTAVVPIAEAFRDAKGSEEWGVVFIKGSSPHVATLAPAVSVKLSVRNRMGLDGDLIVLRNRRVATPTDLMASLSSGDRGALGARQEVDGPSEQARALGKITHPILMVYALTTDKPQPPDGLLPVFVEAEKPLIAVAVAFPRLEPEEALEAARRAKRYLVNTVWLRNAMGLTDDGDDVEDEDED